MLLLALQGQALLFLPFLGWSHAIARRVKPPRHCASSCRIRVRLLNQRSKQREREPSRQTKGQTLSVLLHESTNVSPLQTTTICLSQCDLESPAGTPNKGAAGGCRSNTTAHSSIPYHHNNSLAAAARPVSHSTCCQQAAAAACCCCPRHRTTSPSETQHQRWRLLPTHCSSCLPVSESCCSAHTYTHHRLLLPAACCCCSCSCQAPTNQPTHTQDTIAWGSIIRVYFTSWAGGSPCRSR
jgi:hypothetical protein